MNEQQHTLGRGFDPQAHELEERIAENLRQLLNGD
jgi:predicted component of type VI protein secretion system